MYTLDEGAIEIVRDRLRKINARRTSRQAHPITLHVGEQHRIDQEDGSFFFMWECTLDGSGPIYEDWAFIAAVEHTPHGNIITRVPQSDLPQIDLTHYRTGAQRCDVCNKNRRRVKTYVIVHAQTGEIKVVGSNCLKDFFPINIVSGAILHQLREIEDLDAYMRGGIGSHRALFSVDVILRHTAAMIRTHGWVSRTLAQETNATPTIMRVFANMQAPERSTDWRVPAQEPISDDDIALADATRAWIATLATQDVTTRSDYEHNLVTLNAQGYTDQRGAALVASAISAYRRTLARDAERTRKRAVSKHVGNVGDRTLFENLTVERIFDNDTQYGASYKHIMHDPDGNIYVWQSAYYRLEEGNTYTFYGTIKAHSAYNDIAQTILTRCKYTLTQERAT